MTTMVRKSGLLFRAGDYPDKNFSITPEEMAAAAAAFTFAPNDLEHTPTILSGKLGGIVAVRPGATPDELHGDIEIPVWLNDLTGDSEFKVSLAWDKATKRIVGNALVLDPRITDAAVFAAFSNAGQGAATGTTEPPTGGRRSNSMSWAQKFAEWAKGGYQGDAPEPEQPAVTPPVQFSAPTPDPAIAALEARVKATEAENIRLRQEGIAERAQAFYAAEFAAHRVVPAEQESVIAAFTQAATDDSNHGVVTFSEGVTKSRADILKATYAARQPHVLTQEMISGANLSDEDAKVLFNQMTTRQKGVDKPMTAEARNVYLNASPLGRAALNGSQN